MRTPLLPASLALLVCGTVPQQSPLRATPSAHGKLVAEPPAEVLGLAATLLDGETYETPLTFAEGGALYVHGPFGIERIDSTTGAERLIWRARAGRVDLAYTSPRFFLRAPGSGPLELLDLAAGATRAIPITSQGDAVFTREEKHLLWQGEDGRSSVVDTTTGTLVRTSSAVAPVDTRTRPNLAEDLRFAYLHGQLVDLETNRSIWRPRAAEPPPQRTFFTTIDSETVFVATTDKRVVLVQTGTGEIHESDASCIDRGRWADAVPAPGTWFVRTCPRGLLAVDLGVLVRSQKRVQPLRIRYGRDHFVTDTGTLAVELHRDGGSLWMQQAWGKEPMFGNVPASPLVHRPGLTSTTDGSSWVEHDAEWSCNLVRGTQRQRLWTQCDGTVALSPRGELVARAAQEWMQVLHLPSLQQAFATWSPPAQPREGTLRTELRSDGGIAVTLTDTTVSTPPFVLPHTPGLVPAALERNEDEAQPSRVFLGELVGEVDGLEVRRVHAGLDQLELWSFTPKGTMVPRLRVVLGSDFWIVQDRTSHVQVIGNTARAGTWLRCLETDGSIRPFETCSARMSATLY